MAAKYLRRQTWWVRFYHPRTGDLLRGSLETQDAARAELLRQRVVLGAKGKYQGKVVVVKNWQCQYNPVSHDIQPVKDNPGKVEISVIPQ